MSLLPSHSEVQITFLFSYNVGKVVLFFKIFAAPPLGALSEGGIDFPLMSALAMLFTLANKMWKEALSPSVLLCPPGLQSEENM